MERLALLLGVAVLGLLALVAALLMGIAREGIVIRVTGPLALESGPQEARITVELSGPIEVRLRGPEEADLEIQGAVFPRCDGGVMIPVRWNPFTGEIVWRCVPQEEVPQK